MSLLTDLDQRIAPLDAWLQEQAQGDERVQRLRTHPGLGVLTSLGLVHTLSPRAIASHVKARIDLTK